MASVAARALCHCSSAAPGASRRRSAHQVAPCPVPSAPLTCAHPVVQKQALEGRVRMLTANISSLYDTAKLELQRKTDEIGELRAQ